MKRSSLLIAFYLFLIFAAGIVVGGFSFRLYSGSPVAAKSGTPRRLTPDEWRRQYLSEMQTRLKLSPDQLQQLNSIMDETRTRVHDAHQRADHEMKTIRQQQTDKVRTMLTDAQRAEYEKIRQEHERAHAQQGRH